jgi:hypothetical protein
MKTLSRIATFFFLGSMAHASQEKASFFPPETLYKTRPLVVLAYASHKGLAQQQVTMLKKFNKGLVERKVPIIELDENKSRAFQKAWGLEERPFQAILIGKDGGIKLKSQTPVKATRLFTLIDSMPMRIEEMRIENMN